MNKREKEKKEGKTRRENEEESEMMRVVNRDEHKEGDRPEQKQDKHRCKEKTLGECEKDKPRSRHNEKGRE